jgi:hypothetical protein
MLTASVRITLISAPERKRAPVVHDDDPVTLTEW